MLPRIAPMRAVGMDTAGSKIHAPATGTIEAPIVPSECARTDMRSLQRRKVT